MDRTTLVTMVVLMTATHALALDVTTPGQTVIKGDPGIVQTDIVCPTLSGIYLEDGAKLYLNGHVLDGCSVTTASGSQTDPQNIKVYGPGTIRHGGISLRSGKLRVQDVVIEDSPGTGIRGGGDANDGPSAVVLSRVTVTGSGAGGVQATKVSAQDVTSSGNGVVDQTGIGILGWAGVKGSRVTVADNAGDGVYVSWGRLMLRDATVTGNGNMGVIGDPSITLVRSTVAGNGGDPLEADVVSQVLPRLRLSTCGTSLNVQTLLPWGICTAD